RPNPTWRTPGGEDTEDQVFLLSMEEAVDWLAEKQPPWENNRDFGRFMSSKLITRYEDGRGAWWWLRSPGLGPIFATYVLSDGSLIDFGFGVAAVGGVRPAFWLNLES
ncbi:MAG: DUF6273 domain-containing protein, partial [Cellulomonas sp.]|nr:DUF6273 domain-containing protein [Cellulomonas sp.]